METAVEAGSKNQETSLGTSDMMAGTTDTVTESAQATARTAEVALLGQGREIRLKPPIVTEFLWLEMWVKGTKPDAEFHQEQPRPAGREPPRAKEERGRWECWERKATTMGGGKNGQQDSGTGAGLSEMLQSGRPDYTGD